MSRLGLILALLASLFPEPGGRPLWDPLAAAFYAQRRRGIQSPMDVAGPPELYRATTLSKAEHPFSHRVATRIYMMLIEPAIYLPSVLADFRVAGGQVVVRNFRDLTEVMGLKEQVIVNCTGLGAKALFNDEELIPVKGQLTFLTPQPEINYMYISGSSYMFPRRDGVLLGGTHERGIWTTDPDESIISGMLEDHRRLAEGMR